MATLDTVKSILQDHLEIPAESITMESTFESLKIDSLDLVELVMALEDELGIDFGEPEGLSTVGDVVSYVDSL